jgi:hypothetical protein
MPNPAITRLEFLLLFERFGSRLLWISGGKTKARGHPNKLPIKLTTLSRLSIVAIATKANKQTKKDAMMFRCCKHDVAFPHVASIVVAMDRVAISKDGKFCRGNVNITAILYAS